MLVAGFQKVINYTRQIQEVGLFATMADSRWYAAFGASPVFFIILPFIGLLLTGNALINAYHLAKADNKNLRLWLDFIGSAVCATLASVSLYGAVISAILGLSFIAGPWFFFGSLIVAILHQCVLLSLNIIGIDYSVPGSAERLEYIQESSNIVLTLTILSAAATAVFFMMLLPGVIPFIGTVSAIMAASLTLLDIGWRIFPAHWKSIAMDFLHVNQPIIVDVELGNKNPNALIEQYMHHSSIFRGYNYWVIVNELDAWAGRQFIDNKIKEKINSLQKLYPENIPLKIKDKIGMLQALQNYLKDPDLLLRRQDVLECYPLAFESLFYKQGEIEQIFKAVCIVKQKQEELLKTDLSENLTNSFNL